MKKQIHKRLPKGFVEDVIRTFSEEKISREQASELLGLSRAQLYRWREKYSAFKKKGEDFKLYNKEAKPTRFFPKEVQDFLHEELYYITRCEGRFKNKFNFSFLAEQAEKKFARSFSRNSIRRFALRHNYYHQDPKEKKKVRIRFETPGPGFLFQHDTSHHIWLPLTNSFSDLILTKDDYSRKVVGRRLIEKETSFDHLLTVETTIEEYGLPLAFYVDQHSIFRFVKHKGIHVTYTAITTVKYLIGKVFSCQENSLVFSLFCYTFELEASQDSYSSIAVLQADIIVRFSIVFSYYNGFELAFS